MTGDLFDIFAGTAATSSPFVVIELAGAPRGKGRPRARYVQPKGRPGFVHIYTPKETASYEDSLKWQATEAMAGRQPLDGPLAVRLFAMMPIPDSWPKKRRALALDGRLHPTVKPDNDNIQKIVYDSLNKVVYLDDKQIVRALMVREYAAHPGIIVEVYKL